MAWEAKKEVELLRETMESMFLMFGDKLQEALQSNARSYEAQPTSEVILDETAQHIPEKHPAEEMAGESEQIKDSNKALLL